MNEIHHVHIDYKTLDVDNSIRSHAWTEDVLAWDAIHALRFALSMVLDELDSLDPEPRAVRSIEANVTIVGQ